MTFTDINALAAQLFPDIGAYEIPPSAFRQIVTALAAGQSGYQFHYIAVDVVDYGNQVTIPGALASHMVMKGGIGLTPGVDYSFAAAGGDGVWTFTDPLALNNTLLIVWS